ncbi:MAG: hypothetical protein U0822_19895 [Anaerolineae bacterium]
MQQILFDVFLIVLVLWPVAAGVSYMKDRQRLAEKMRRQQEAEGRIELDPRQTAWHDYRRKYDQLARERAQAEQAQKQADDATH